MSAATVSLPSAPVSLAVGATMPAVTLGPLTRTDIVRYAGAGGDLNPIHHDEPLAQGAGMPTVFAMGMMHAGMLGNRLARWVGPDSLRSFGVRFTGQVWPGDELTLTGTVTSIEEGEGGPLAEIALSVTSQKGDEVLRGWATALVAPGS